MLEHTSPSSSERNDQASVLLGLARDYSRAAGEAFARGADEYAAKFRTASDQLTELAGALPPIPRRMRG